MSLKFIKNVMRFTELHNLSVVDIKDSYESQLSIKVDCGDVVIFINGLGSIFDDTVKGFKLGKRTLIGFVPDNQFSKFYNKFGEFVVRLIPVEQLLGLEFTLLNCDARIMTEEEKELLTITMFADGSNLPELPMSDALCNILMAKRGDWIRCETASQINPSSLHYYQTGLS